MKPPSMPPTRLPRQRRRVGFRGTFRRHAHSYGFGFLLILAFVVRPGQSQTPTSYANVTLVSRELSVLVYLPQGIKPNEPVFYQSSRFEGSSMIGSVQRRVPRRRVVPSTIERGDTRGAPAASSSSSSSSPTSTTSTTASSASAQTATHQFYGSDLWRTPHNPASTEGAIGLASEFGVGDDGAFCNYQCGWNAVNDVTNGLLGYQQAKTGESFLKIGVGELVKGSCPICDSTDNYRFNSPYRFAKPTAWVMEHNTNDKVVLYHRAMLNEYGYMIRKEIRLDADNVLEVQTTLTNLGRIPFSTAWYSHHLFSCDHKRIGPGYSVNLNLTGTAGRYEEPGTWFWSTPLANYAEKRATPTSVKVEMQRAVEDNVRIKAEFVKDGTSDGGFTLNGCETSIDEIIPELSTRSKLSMYAFNLYIEAGTFSPEPQILIQLYPGQAETWTQRLVFRDDPSSVPAPGTVFNAGDLPPTLYGAVRGTSIAPARQHGSHRRQRHSLPRVTGIVAVYLVGCCCGLLYMELQRRRRRSTSYDPIPDLGTEQHDSGDSAGGS